MQTIDLTGTPSVITNGHTSKGNQPKWNVHTDWYKADHHGYEALAETLVSWMLSLSTVTGFVKYTPIKIVSNGNIYIGCRSQDFLCEHETLVPVAKLHRAHCGIGLAEYISKLQEVTERIEYTASFVESATGIKNFGFHLSTILELDAFTLNEDRHTNNIAVIRNEIDGTFRLCPIFDNGLSLLSDLVTYPLRKDIYEYMGMVKAKPFSQDFLEQVEAASKLYGSFTRFAFTREQLHQKLMELAEYYDTEVIDRVERVVLEQIRKHSYLF